MRRTNKNLNVINVIAADGTISEVATYEGKYSAYYALTLFYCKMFKLDFFNREHLDKARANIKPGYSKKTCSFEVGKDIYSCCAPEGKLYDEGIGGSDYAFTPPSVLTTTSIHS